MMFLSIKFCLFAKANSDMNATSKMFNLIWVNCNYVNQQLLNDLAKMRNNKQSNINGDEIKERIIRF